MSLRRKSCETCFRGKRKCDLEYPICKRCRRTGKTCHYVYPPVDASQGDEGPTVEHKFTGDIIQMGDYRSTYEKAKSPSGLLFAYQTIPNQLSPLGEVQPVARGTRSWQWLVDELKTYPLAVGRNLQTTFMHPSLHDNHDRASGMAFSICAAYESRNWTNYEKLSEVMNSEAAELLQSASATTIVEELSKMQALVLYQIIRLLHGDVTKRMIAEQQMAAIKARGLQLLTRADAELGALQSTWKSWLLAENIRRTVMIAYMVFAMYSLYRFGACYELPTLARLPVSTRTDLWESDRGFVPDDDITLNYEDFAASWAASPTRRLEPYEMILIVACKGIEQIEKYYSSADPNSHTSQQEQAYRTRKPTVQANGQIPYTSPSPCP